MVYVLAPQKFGLELCSPIVSVKVKSCASVPRILTVMSDKVLSMIYVVVQSKGFEIVMVNEEVALLVFAPTV